MHIFVDEAGPFVTPPSKAPVSCVGALVVRDAGVDELFSDFQTLKQSWGDTTTEIKGSKLDEAQVAALIETLKAHEVIFEATTIDMSMHAPAAVTAHRLDQADKMIANVEGHTESLVAELHELRQRMQQLPDQLYAQAVCTFELLYRVVQNATLYFCQRHPQELANFYWAIDAKQGAVTSYEDLWNTIVSPLLQTKSFSEPLLTLDEGDYSFLEQHFGSSPEPPEYLAQAASGRRPFQYIVMNDIYGRHFEFSRSHDNLGLQIVDILTTSLRRAINGHLRIEGWGEIGRLMILQTQERGQTIQMIRLGGHSQRVSPPYLEVFAVVQRTARSMLL
jgi:hypothetical protein